MAELNSIRKFQLIKNVTLKLEVMTDDEYYTYAQYNQFDPDRAFIDGGVPMPDTEMWDLLDGEVFLHDPAGLGLSISSDTSGYDNYFQSTNTSIDSNLFTGTLAFIPSDKNPLDSYGLFKQFCYGLDCDLLLAYSTQNGTFFREMELVSIDKTEASLGAYLDVPFTFKFTSPWTEKLRLYPDVLVPMDNIGKIYGNDGYEPIENNTGGYAFNDYDGDEQENNGSYYVYEEASDAGANHYMVDNNADLMQDMGTLEFLILAENAPIVGVNIVLIRDEDNKIMATDSYDITIPQGQMLAYTSDLLNPRIQMLTWAEEIGDMQSIYWSARIDGNNGFVRVPKGRFRLEILDDEGNFLGYTSEENEVVLLRGYQIC